MHTSLGAVSGEMVVAERDGHYIAGPKTVNLAEHELPSTPWHRHRSLTMEPVPSQSAQKRSPPTATPKRSLSFSGGTVVEEPAPAKSQHFDDQEPRAPAVEPAAPAPKAKRPKTTYDKYYHQSFGCNFIDLAH